MIQNSKDYPENNIEEYADIKNDSHNDKIITLNRLIVKDFSINTYYAECSFFVWYSKLLWLIQFMLRISFLDLYIVVTCNYISRLQNIQNFVKKYSIYFLIF